ncbi:MAG: hypothetical protein ACOH13_02590 [Flavobacteriales bacterium]
MAHQYMIVRSNHNIKLKPVASNFHCVQKSRHGVFRTISRATSVAVDLGALLGMHYVWPR